MVDAGLRQCRPEGSIYIWQQIPEGFDSVSFAKRLLGPQMAMVVMPVGWLSEATAAGNPGEGFVRIALSPNLEECEIAASRIRQYLKPKP